MYGSYLDVYKYNLKEQTKEKKNRITGINAL